MFDSHTIANPNWGIRPILFTLYGIEVPSYSSFILLGLLTGLAVYYYFAKKDRVLNHNSSVILIAGLTSGILGAKLLEWLFNYEFVWASLPNFELLLSGRTIIGGVLGGTIGVLLTKRFFGIRDRRGNQFAPGIAIGIAIGRIGCWLAGCCYGVPTTLPWGVDFGDGILRHPTQLYESLFCLGLCIYLMTIRDKVTKPGALFQRFMTIYLTYRFFIEFIRVEPIMLWGLTGYQLVCAAGIIFVHREYWLEFVRRKSFLPG